MRWTGLKENDDYVLGYEHLIYGVNDTVSSLLYKEIPELKAIEWLGSIITPKRNYIWLHRVADKRKDPLLTFRENRLEGMPPIKHYQKLLIKHLEHRKTKQQNDHPKVDEVDEYYVFFKTKKHQGRNGICRATLDRYSMVIIDRNV
jgi:hypothetical protein